ncbi:hypothetical protein GOP47_0019434 [Adiantum capillus-veneris]|uniref:Uncharacterized protein n=1 Tax=Adiantum capillus-veneris TaxID=13818 RepID=A0A9D4UCK0_ADICA|nr:hypothetical protein GOP47_0019434 [Adiantum capillus-veneris]
MEEDVMDETDSDVKDNGRSSYRMTDETIPMQKLLEQFEKARLQERHLRKKELMKLVETMLPIAV